MTHPAGNGTLRDELWIEKTPSSYSPSQVSRWLACIGFESRFTEQDIATGRFPTTLDNLCLLVQLQLVTFPYENTEMHYTAHHRMDVSVEGLYRRMVVERQGSYCFGLNILFLQMMRGLGYRAYSGSGRINLAMSNPPNYTSLVHMVIFVQPLENSNITYLVDVGCGGSGPTRPILLSDVVDNIVMGTSPTERHRLTRGAHPDSIVETSQYSSIPGKLDWRLEVFHEKGEEATWKIVYSFSEMEFFQTDFESANVAVSMARGGLFWDNVISSKHFWLSNEIEGVSRIDHSADGNTKERYLGRIAMEGGTIRRHTGNHSEIVRTVRTEVERTRALQELFGIYIADSDLTHIQGREATIESRSAR